jgi:two-component system sensor histidine kinase BaeS
VTALARLPLRWRLALLLGAILLATIGFLLVAVSLAAERVLIDSTADRLEIGAGLVVDRPRKGPPSTALDASAVAQLLGGQGTAVTILDASGTTLATAENGAPPNVAAARLTAADYSRAISGGTTIRQVVASPDGRMLVVASPIQLSAGGKPGKSDGGPPFVPPGQAKKNSPAPATSAGAGGGADSGVTDAGTASNAIAQLAVSLTPIDSTIVELRNQLAVLALVALAAGLLATIVITRRATRPLDRVAAAAARLASGDLAARTGVSGGDEVGAVGRSFDEMADRLEAAFRAQRAFAADASHELQTPLAVLGGYVDLLNLRSLPADEQQRLLASMRREIDRLSRLAADLLMLARLDAGGPVLQPRQVDLADLVREIAEPAGMIDAAVGVVVRADGPLPVVADPDRFAQALLNLAENAVRHSISGTPVVIRTFRDGAMAAVEVANAGPPIPPDELPRLFERFVRGTGRGVVAGQGDGDDAVPAGPQRAGHAGLGLPIARAIVEASGGRIEAASDDRGTRFTILLPLLEAPDSQPLLSEPGPSPA